MSEKGIPRLAFLLVLAAALSFVMAGCSLTQTSANELGAVSGRGSSSVYGSWESSSELAEEQLMRESESRASGVSSGASSGAGAEELKRRNHFRDTSEGEPVAIHQFVNRVLVDDEYAKITLQAKTADYLGDAGFTLIVENRYTPLTSVGYENHCYLTPVMGTWTVNGVRMDPKTEGKVYPGKTGMIYLYFDELDSIDQLVEVKGEFELYLISDWWNPVETYEFAQP
ncbi:MAG: hypothetical protein LBL23_00205 [Coriobacteriales bacterium]|nr:hypothetical protein [Coriobacteriales bacterium]